MNVSLTPELRKFVDNEVKGGSYATASEVVRESLRLLQREKVLIYIRAEAQKGADDFAAGRYTTLKTPEDFENFEKRLIAEGLERLKKKRVK